jgi:hypothetical protein
MRLLLLQGSGETLGKPPLRRRRQAAVRKKAYGSRLISHHSDPLAHALRHRNLLRVHHFIYLVSESRQLSLERKSGCPGANRDFFCVSRSPGAIDEYESSLLDVTGHRARELNQIVQYPFGGELEVLVIGGRVRFHSRPCRIESRQYLSRCTIKSACFEVSVDMELTQGPRLKAHEVLSSK